jgi:hypothetical protein
MNLATAGPAAVRTTDAAIIVVLLLVELGFLVPAIIDLAQRRVVTWGNKWIWAAIIVLFGIVGPIVYFVAGRPAAQVAESRDEAAERSAGAAERAGNVADLLYGPRDGAADGQNGGGRSGDAPS